MLLIITLLLPILGGAAMAALRFGTDRRRHVYVEAVVLLTSALTAVLLLRHYGERVRVVELLRGMELAFAVDGPGAVFAGLVAVLWPMASLYAFEYMMHEERRNAFFAWYTMCYGVTLAVALAANLFTLYIFYECLTLVTLPLVTHKEDPASIRAGRRYLTYSITGAAMGFISLAVCAAWGQSLDFRPGGGLGPEALPLAAQVLQVLFLVGFVGFGTKAAVFPMHAWLPAAAVAPTPVTALLHAVAVVNAGAFAVIRLIYHVYGAAFLHGSLAGDAALCLSCFTIVFASATAVREQHLKRRLAWSTVANLSYMLMGACLMTPAGMAGALTHLVCHGIMKITLFYCAGAILVRSGKEYVQELRGYGSVMPFTAAVFTVGSAAMVGLPPLCGFTGKWSLLTAAAALGSWRGPLAVAALMISAVLTAVYLFNVVFQFWFRPPEGEERARLDPTWRMKVPLGILCVLMLLLGVWAGPLTAFLRDAAAGLV